MNDGYAGPGIWIRIRHRFGPLMTEWFMAGHMLMFGYVLLLPTETFNQPTFAAFRVVPTADWLSISPEGAIGGIMLMVGALRVIGLIVNGAREKVTPQIRQASAMIGCILWSGIAYGFFSSDIVSTWFAIYPLFAVCELVNIHRAAHDEGEIRNGTTG